MKRYVTIARRKASRASWDDDNEILTTTQVIVEGDDPIDTGLVHAHGTPIYRLSDKIKPGFVA